MQITDGVLRYGPYAMFVLLPAFALLLKIRLSRPRAPVSGAARGCIPSTSSSPPTTTRSCSSRIIAATVFIDLARAAVIVWMLVYMLWSLRVVYRGIVDRNRDALSFVMLISYTVLFGLCTADARRGGHPAALTRRAWCLARRRRHPNT